MAHEVESMAYTGAVPWHGLGTQVTDPADAISPARFLKLAGLDWEVEKIPVVTADTQAETSHFATRRKSDGRVLGVVGPGYKVFQNSSAFGWFEPFLESGRATLEAGGSLRHGAIVWGLARISTLEGLVRPGDKVENFILLSHGHDGYHGIQVGFTPTRVICANTLAAAEGHHQSQLMKVRHTAGLDDAMEQIRDLMDLEEQDFRATMEQYSLLATTPVDRRDIERYVKIVIGVEEKPAPQTKTKVDRIVELAHTGRGNTGESLWDAYNGVTEYLSYEAGRSQDSRIRSLWFGDAEKLSRKALGVGVEIANGELDL